MNILQRVMWATVGAAVAYLLDPISGRSRRARLADQLRARARDWADAAAKKTRYQMGRARGVVHEAMKSEERPRDDAELLQKVRSEAVGMIPGSLGHVEVLVEDGVVHLVGRSHDAARERELEHRIRGVTGVKEVSNELAPL